MDTNFKQKIIKSLDNKELAILKKTFSNNEL